MKNRIIVLLLLPLLTVISCKKDLTSINIDPKSPTTAPGGAFFISAEKTFSDLQNSSSVNENIFRLIVQYWQETTYLGESQYDLVERQLPRQAWNYYYRDVIRPLREAKKVIPNDITINPTVQKNQLAIAEIMEVYTWYYLVTTFGDIPYTEALDITKPSPKYDDQKTIYNDLLTRLDAAIGNLTTTAASFGGSDIYYNGNVTQWKKFANSIKLKMGMTIADFDNTKAKSIVESAVASGVFTSNADNAAFNYVSGRPNDNPIHDYFITQAREEDFVIASTIANKMNALNDPRREHYFTEDANGSYSGGEPGEASDYIDLSKPDPSIFEEESPSVVLDYSEVEFLLAEAVERGYAVGALSAAQHYANAIRASITYWGGTLTEANAYLAQPSVNYATAPGNFRQKIGEQKWIALYNRGWDAWIEWRRLDYPKLNKAADAKSDIPLRFTYPIPEQNVNKSNYDAASSAIGGDVVTTKLFWDKL